MKLSRKSDYALRALLHLATIPRDAPPVPVRELAEQNGIPRKFLEAIMRELREKGIVLSIAGKKGGYKLRRRPEDITIGVILRYFDGHLESFEAEFDDKAASPEEPRLMVQRVLRDIGRKVDSLMDQTTLAVVVSGTPLRYEITSRDTYADGGGI
ncbi:MAG: Rrf2 family transcriptional regulator [Candidatus Sumerlaeia bacterium]|nr:Rrf2 family transcriptional regulator [Candidatus Sumerlaeia bacterium]